MDGPYEISLDRSRLDTDLIHGFLRESYWAQGIPRFVVESAIRNSLCVGAYRTDGALPAQVGFGRLVTDFVSMAYLADVFVLPGHRGRGVATAMVQAFLDHPDLTIVRRFLLITRDAHDLYAQAGFEVIANPTEFMTLRRVTTYLDPRFDK